jgi:hypothetical protein
MLVVRRRGVRLAGQELPQCGRVSGVDEFEDRGQGDIISVPAMDRVKVPTTSRLAAAMEENGLIDRVVR